MAEIAGYISRFTDAEIDAALEKGQALRVVNNGWIRIPSTRSDPISLGGLVNPGNYLISYWADGPVSSDDVTPLNLTVVSLAGVLRQFANVGGKDYSRSWNSVEARYMSWEFDQLAGAINPGPLAPGHPVDGSTVWLDTSGPVPILKVYKNGSWKALIPPGVMLTSVYDTTGKATDIYQYIEDTVNNAALGDAEDEFNAHINNALIHVTEVEKDKWNDAPNQEDFDAAIRGIKEVLTAKLSTEVSGSLQEIDDLSDLADTLDTAITAHLADTDIHPTAHKMAEWDSKANGDHTHDRDGKVKIYSEDIIGPLNENIFPNSVKERTYTMPSLAAMYSASKDPLHNGDMVYIPAINPSDDDKWFAVVDDTKLIGNSMMPESIISAETRNAQQYRVLDTIMGSAATQYIALVAAKTAIGYQHKLVIINNDAVDSVINLTGKGPSEYGGWCIARNSFNAASSHRFGLAQYCNGNLYIWYIDDLNDVNTEEPDAEIPLAASFNFAPRDQMHQFIKLTCIEYDVIFTVAGSHLIYGGLSSTAPFYNIYSSFTVTQPADEFRIYSLSDGYPIIVGLQHTPTQNPYRYIPWSGATFVGNAMNLRLSTENSIVFDGQNLLTFTVDDTIQDPDGRGVLYAHYINLASNSSVYNWTSIPLYGALWKDSSDVIHTELRDFGYTSLGATHLHGNYKKYILMSDDGKYAFSENLYTQPFIENEFNTPGEVTAFITGVEHPGTYTSDETWRYDVSQNINTGTGAYIFGYNTFEDNGNVEQYITDILKITYPAGSYTDAYIPINNTKGAVSWDDIIGKPTTMEGFGITDAATLAELQAILAQIPANMDVNQIVKMKSEMNVLMRDIDSLVLALQALGTADTILTNALT